jgi:hypothetical protein
MNKSHFPRNIIVLIFLVTSVIYAIPARSQTVLEAGPLVGVSWYNGDLNPQRQFYQMHPSIGIVARYIVNDRIAYRASASFATISGAYPATKVIFPQTSNAPYSFSRNLGDFTAMFEWNLFSFDHPFKKESTFTPYATIGIGSVFYKRYLQENGNLSEKPLFVLSLPFGAGVKWKVTDGIKLGLEWTFRKTFADDLDYVGTNNSVNPSDPYGFNESSSTHNNDWISVVGATVSFSLIKRNSECNSGF